MITLTIIDIDDIEKDYTQDLKGLLSIINSGGEVEDLIELREYSEEESILSAEKLIEQGYELFSDCFKGKEKDCDKILYVQTMIKYAEKAEVSND